MLRSAPMTVLSSPVSKPLWPRCAVAGILGTLSGGVRLFAHAEDLLDGLHDWEFEVFLFITEMFQLAQIFLELLWFNDPSVVFAMIEAAQPSGGSSGRADLGMHKLITRNLCCVDGDLCLRGLERTHDESKG